MVKYQKSKIGYIVYEDSGTSLMNYGACEKWFSTYDEATIYAIRVVRQRVSQFKDIVDYNSVIVYEGSKELLKETHSVPCGRVIFEWRNYHKTH